MGLGVGAAGRWRSSVAAADFDKEDCLLWLSRCQRHVLGMAAAEDRDGRNFRQTYYEKVGFKGVEEKRSLEMILNERPLDVNRLTQFTCRFNLPDVHRERVWLLLLGMSSSSCSRLMPLPVRLSADH